MHSLRGLAATTFALVAFAGNSILCRLALGEATIDAASFSAVRLVSGALTLIILSGLGREAGRVSLAGDWTSAAALFLYAVPFSFAYVTLAAGTGALILFGAVQVTMIVAALWGGERPGPGEWVGIGIALAGLVYLVSPGVTAPTPVGSSLMAVAGIAWGVYSLRGRAVRRPLAATAGNFVRTTPFAVLIVLMIFRDVHVSATGVLLAVASGAVASGIGYAVWYSALRQLTATRAALVQLASGTLVGRSGRCGVPRRGDLVAFVRSGRPDSGRGRPRFGSRKGDRAQYTCLSNERARLPRVVRAGRRRSSRADPTADARAVRRRSRRALVAYTPSCPPGSTLPFPSPSGARRPTPRKAERSFRIGCGSTPDGCSSCRSASTC